MMETGKEGKNQHIQLSFQKWVGAKERDSCREEESYRYLEGICLENGGIGDINCPPHYNYFRKSLYLVKGMLICNAYHLPFFSHENCDFYTTITSHKDNLDEEIIEKFRKFYGKEWRQEII